LKKSIGSISDCVAMFRNRFYAFLTEEKKYSPTLSIPLLNVYT